MGPRRWLATRRVEATESPGPASSGRRPLKVYEAGDEVHVAHVRGDYAKLLLPQGGVGWAAIRGPPAPRVPGRLVADDDALVPLDEAAWRRWGRCRVHVRAGKESEIPNFKGSYLGRVPLVSADFWTSDHLLERPRSVDAFSGTRARGTLTLKRR